MKKTGKILSLTAFALILATGLAPEAKTFLGQNGVKRADAAEIQDLLTGLQQGFSVSGRAVETLTYPEGYSQYDTSTTTTFARDYGTLLDDHGEEHNAIRIQEGDRFVLYYEGEDRSAYQEVLLPDNTVGTIKYGSLGLDVLYSSQFANPFDYVDRTDIDAEYHLDKNKASFVLSTLTGIDWAVSSAQFVFEDGNLEGLSFDLAEKPLGISDSNGSFLTITGTLEVEMSLSLLESQFGHLSPSTNENPELEEALDALDSNNFTVTFTSNGLQTRSRLFVTQEGLYFQQNASENGPRNGDILYVRMGGIYETYTIKNGLPDPDSYSLSTTSPINTYLGGLSTIAPELFQKKEDNLYRLGEDAIAYGAPALVPSTYSMAENSGVEGYITLKDGKIEDVVSVLFSTANVTFVSHFENHGTTSLPVWVDATSL